MHSKNFRWLQQLTGIHRIHHITYGYGYKFFNHGVFVSIWTHLPEFQRLKGLNIDYHNCTLTNTY